MKRAQAKYQDKILVARVNANPDTEANIYQWLSQQENKSGAIKALIEKEIAGMEDELQSNRKGLASINQLIEKYSEELGIFFVEYSTQNRLRDLLTVLSATYHKTIVTIDCEAFESAPNTHFDEWLVGVVTERLKHQNLVAVNVIGIENLLSKDKDTVSAALNGTYWHKSCFQQLALPFFFWTTSKGINDISSLNPVFFDKHSEVIVIK